MPKVNEPKPRIVFPSTPTDETQPSPAMPIAPMPSPKKRMRRNDKIALIVIASLLVAFGLIVAIIFAIVAPQTASISPADQQATATANAVNANATNVAIGETAISNDQLTQAASTPAPIVTDVPV